MESGTAGIGPQLDEKSNLTGDNTGISTAEEQEQKGTGSFHNPPGICSNKQSDNVTDSKGEVK